MSADRRGTHAVKLAFKPDTIDLAIEQLVPLKVLRPGAKESKKYAQIRDSIKAIELVEAPVVARNPADSMKFFLLDGHMRIEALKDLGVQHVECLVSTDDETYTYNKRINRLAAVQEHSMIKRAIARGVPEAAIAEALGLNIETIFRRTRLLNGICPEAVEVLKDTSSPMAVFDILRRMGPIRQVEAGELMAGQNNYSVQFAKALLAATPDAEISTDTSEAYISIGSRLQLSDADFARTKNGLRELVLLRNNLVHHFVDQHDIVTLDGCRGGRDALIAAYTRIDQHFEELRAWGRDVQEARRALAEVVQSDSCYDLVIDGIHPDGAVFWPGAGIVRALQEASSELAVEGWADRRGGWQMDC